MAGPSQAMTGLGIVIAMNGWKLVYDFNALCTIEEELDVDVTEVGDKLNSPTMIRSIFRIGLQAHHGVMSDLEAGRLIHDMGPAAAAEVIGRAFQAAFPDATAGSDASAEGKAPRKKAGSSVGR